LFKGPERDDNTRYSSIDDWGPVPSAWGMKVASLLDEAAMKRGNSP
jgi:hypothetical protein